MEIIEGNKLNAAYVSINKVAISRTDISSFSWDENTFELQVFMQSGYEHSFCFDDKDSFAEAIFKLCK